MVVVSVVVGLVSLKLESECFSTTMVPKVVAVELSAPCDTSRKSPISTLFTSSLKLTFISKSSFFGVIKASTIDILSSVGASVSTVISSVSSSVLA